MKPSYIIDKYGTLEEKLISEGFHGPQRFLNTDKYFIMKIGQTVNRRIPSSEEQLFYSWNNY